MKRMTSWYDANIVTQEGEEILGRYDDWAIKVLRKHQLVWSGWAGSALSPGNSVRAPGGMSARVIEGEDWARLPLFLLSVLWRAAVSKLPEFSEVVLPRTHLTQLASMLVEGTSEPQTFYPARLIQLTTKGPRHNHTPLALEMPFAAQGPVLAHRKRIFRFFIEGLIVHFDRDITSNGQLRGLGFAAVGASPKLGILGLPFAGSAQANNLARAMAETYVDWPKMRSQVLAAMTPDDLRPPRRK